jgi:hypothetical protein
MEAAMYKFAEVSREANAVVAFGEAPFLPCFAPGHPTFCVDITGMEPAPLAGYIYDPGAGAFAPPPGPAEPDPYAGYLGDLALETATGGQFTAENMELNVRVGLPVVVTGRITDRDGQVVDAANMTALRMPLLPTDLSGHPLPGTQPSLAAASIANGIVTATWEPEFTGTYAITEEAVNIRLPEGARLKFKGLHVFVMPGAAQ